MTDEQLKRANEICKEIAKLIYLKNNITYETSDKNRQLNNRENITIGMGIRLSEITGSNDNKSYYYEKLFEKELLSFRKNLLKKINSEIKKLEKEYEKL